LQFKKESRRATSASKTIINKKEARDNAKEAKEIEVEAKRIKVDTKVDAKASAKATIIAITIATTIVDTKRLLKSRERFACIYINFVLETTSILLSCLLLFNNSRKYTNNALYS